MRITLTVVMAGLLATVLQTTVLAMLAPLPLLVPNVVLVLAIYLGLRHHGVAGAVGAFLLGYLLDTFSGTVLGPHAFGCTAAYMVAYLISRTLWTEGGLPAMVVVFLGACVHAIAAEAIVVLVDAAWPGWAAVVSRGLVQALLAALVTPWVLSFLAWERRLVQLA